MGVDEISAPSQSSRICLTQSSSIGRQWGPLSPTAKVQSMKVAANNSSAVHLTRPMPVHWDKSNEKLQQLLPESQFRDVLELFLELRVVKSE